jgi:redox-regulated HSP33 family molecular chaperone
MTKKIITFAGIALLALAVQVAPAMAQANVAGAWTLTLEGPEGPVDTAIVLTQDGATVSGTIEMDQVDYAELSDGMIEGNTLTFMLIISVQGQEIALEATGEVDGDTIEGELYVPDFGGFPFSAVRSEG